MSESEEDPSAIATTVDADELGAAGQARVYLVVSRQAGSREVLEPADGEEIILGRARDSGISVDDSRVSRRHARLIRRGSAFSVEDLGSSNGTRLNERTLRGESALASGGDLVRVGPIEIVIAASASAPAPPASPEAPGVDPRDEVVVADPSMQRVFQVARRLARSDTTVLILGETGVGKEVVAEEIHRSSARARGPFVRVNCAALPESIQESELFGHERGAFTGADRRKVGLIEAANGGTLLLDEVGEMSPKTQAELLLAVENRTITRVGGTQEVPVDVRVLSATHRDLWADAENGLFRLDLYYRLSVFSLVVPPLRERPTEVALLARLFAQRSAERLSHPPPVLSPEALGLLERHLWPGNVRELRNAMEHAVVLADDGLIRPEHLPPAIGRPPGSVPPGALRNELANVERKNIESALQAENGNQTRAARRLGISRRALIYKMQKYNVRG